MGSWTPFVVPAPLPKTDWLTARFIKALLLDRLLVSRTTFLSIEAISNSLCQKFLLFSEVCINAEWEEVQKIDLERICLCSISSRGCYDHLFPLSEAPSPSLSHHCNFFLPFPNDLFSKEQRKQGRAQEKRNALHKKDARAFCSNIRSSETKEESERWYFSWGNPNGIPVLQHLMRKNFGPDVRPAVSPFYPAPVVDIFTAAASFPSTHFEFPGDFTCSYEMASLPQRVLSLLWSRIKIRQGCWRCFLLNFGNGWN